MNDYRERNKREAAQETGWSSAVWALLLGQLNSPRGVADALWEGGGNILINGTPLLPDNAAEDTLGQIRLYEPSLPAHNLPVPRLIEAEFPEIEIQASRLPESDADSLRDRLVAQVDYLLDREGRETDEVFGAGAELGEEEPESQTEFLLIGEDLPGRKTARVDRRGVSKLLNLPQDRFTIQPIHRGQEGAVVFEDGWARVTLTPVMAVPTRDSAVVFSPPFAADHGKDPDPSAKTSRGRAVLGGLIAGLGGGAAAIAAHIAAGAAHVAAAAAVVDPILIQVDVADGAPVSCFMAKTIEDYNRAQRAVVRMGTDKMSDAMVAALTQKMLQEGRLARDDRQGLARLSGRLQQSVAVRLEEARLLQELLRSTFNHLVVVQMEEAKRGKEIILSPEAMAAIGFGARHAFLGLETQRRGVNTLSSISWDQVNRFIHSSGYFAMQ
ncbi:hypothetical protein KKB64_02265 [Patescibacteria group bacterium]|nr:hypothetical protein [Patescibacteria group bacterium]MBU1472593.1 hypothetical protein [Patescibacteria group bacterium]MBU2459845.1 hypothetical protein [Patescibacteria group bacterium]MBU2544094.1 hypothetical protein [Patescibacteria group bacterium]